MRAALLLASLLLATPSSAAPPADRGGSATEEACSADGLLACVRGTVNVSIACVPLGGGEYGCESVGEFLLEGRSGLPVAPRATAARAAETNLVVCYPGGLCMSVISTLVPGSCIFGPLPASCSHTTIHLPTEERVTLGPGECFDVRLEGWMYSEVRLEPARLNALVSGGGPMAAAVTVASTEERVCA